MTNTVSLDVAKRLKAAGLSQRAEIGDYIYVKYLSTHTLPAEAILVTGDRPSFPIDVFAPALSDILSRLEKLGYIAVSGQAFKKHEGKKYYCSLFAENEKYEWLEKDFSADTPEDAAGLALIWALGQEG